MNDSVLTLSVGQALEVQDALRRQGLSLSFLKDATSGTWFSQLNTVMGGGALRLFRSRLNNLHQPLLQLLLIHSVSTTPLWHATQLR